MPEFRFYQPIQVRYGDLDPQGHVNNARYLTYMEHARIAYLINAGLWDGGSFDEIGIILADIRITFLAPIQLGDQIRVGARVTRLGNKSMEMVYVIEATPTQLELARGTSTLVTYDYRKQQSIVIPEVWRHGIASFENLPVQEG